MPALKITGFVVAPILNGVLLTATIKGNYNTIAFEHPVTKRYVVGVKSSNATSATYQIKFEDLPKGQYNNFNCRLANLPEVKASLKKEVTVIASDSSPVSTFRRTNTVNVLDLGLIPDGVFRNELLLAEAMHRLPKGTTFFFPSADKPYLFGPLPEKYNFEGIPVAINRDASECHFEGERPGTVLEFLPECIGMQLTSGISNTMPCLSRLKLKGRQNEASLKDGKVTYNGKYWPGTEDYNVDFGRPIGAHSILHLTYHYSGINARTGVNLENVDIEGFSGHGLSIVGSPDLKATGVPYEIKGRMHDFAEGRFYPYDKEQLKIVRYGWKATYVKDGKVIECMVGCHPSDYDYMCIDNIKSFGEEVTITVSPKGGAMIADNSILYNCNFDFNNGAAVNIAGADANQTKFFGCSMRENGWRAVLDASFLCTVYIGTHATKNNKNFNYYAPNADHANDKLVAGNFSVVNSSARSVLVGCYDEQDGGPRELAANAISLGGMLGSGFTGPGLVFDGTSVTNLVAGVAHFKKDAVSYPHGNEAALDMREWRQGKDIAPMMGYGFVDRMALLYNDGRTKVKRSDDSFRELALAGIHTNHSSVGGAVSRTYDKLDNFLTDVRVYQLTVEVGDTLTLYNPGEGMPISYICCERGTLDTMKLRPTSGIGMGKERPDASKLSRHHTGYEWYDPAKGKSMFNGTAWV